MRKREISFPSSDGRTAIHAVIWEPEERRPRAVLQIAHGMTEFIERYEAFAGFLVGQGFLVAGHDHLGHGASVVSPGDRGYFAEKNGAACLLKDMGRLRRAVWRRYPDIPYFMLGHSMGSFFLKAYLEKCGEGISGAILMGNGYIPNPVLRAGLRLTARQGRAHGWRYRSPLVQKLFFLGPFGRYDMTGKVPERSWLSRDGEAVRAYYGDERSRFQFTLNAYDGFLRTILYGNRKKNMGRLPKELPFLLVSGKEDPVGNFGRGVRRVKRKLERAGVKNVEMKLYEGDRHEILNELDKEQVFLDIALWCERVMRHRSHPEA